MLYACMLLFYRAELRLPLPLRQSRLEAAGDRLSRPAAAGRRLLAIGTFISTLTKNQIIAGAATFGVCLLLWVFEWVSGYETATWAQVLAYMSVITHFDSFAEACSIVQRRDLLPHA